MRRRAFIATIAGAAGYVVSKPRLVRSESLAPKPRVGVLWHGGSAEEESVYLTAFRQGLADVGYVEGRNIVVEHRFPAEKPELFQSMAAELVGLKPNVLVAAGQPPALALSARQHQYRLCLLRHTTPSPLGLSPILRDQAGTSPGCLFPI
jgi:putative tryptophan/tyrosine transport system substrate-binding protein